MYRFFTRQLCLGLIAFGCGSPGDLDRDRFPDLADTGYPDRVGVAGASSGGTFGGTGGSSGVGGLNAGGSAGTAPVGGAGGAVAGSGGSGQPGGAGGGTGQAGAGQSGAGNDPGGACPSDITVLLNRPGPMGGCAGAGCHIQGGTPPDLTSPGVEARVLNVASTCNNIPYVGATGSMIEDKITGNPPTCGSPMPLFAANMLSAADEACIIEWIDGLAGGM